MSTVKVDNLQARSDDVLTIPSSLNVTGYSANVSGNVSVARSLVVGYTDGRIPQANLDVKGNAVIGTTVYVASNNTVGIGAMPHVGKLYVDSGGTSITGQFGSTAAATTYLRLGASGTTAYPQLAVNTNTLTIRTGYADRMAIDDSGNFNLNDHTFSRANLKDYGEVTSALGSAGGARTIDLEDGNNFTATVSASTVTWTFSNPTASDELCGFTLFLTNGGSQTVNWPGSVDWAGGTAPTLTTSGLDILVLVTTDGGTMWHGMVVSAASK